MQWLDFYACKVDRLFFFSFLFSIVTWITDLKVGGRMRQRSNVEEDAEKKQNKKFNDLSVGNLTQLHNKTAEKNYTVQEDQELYSKQKKTI